MTPADYAAACERAAVATAVACNYKRDDGRCCDLCHAQAETLSALAAALRKAEQLNMLENTYVITLPTETT